MFFFLFFLSLSKFSQVESPVSIHLLHNLGLLAGLIHGAYIPTANSDLYIWRQEHGHRDAGSQLGLANTWSNCLDYVVPAVTALVSGVGFCNVYFFTG